MDTTKETKHHYEVWSGIDLTAVGVSLAYPPQVVRMWRDGRGRRQVQIVAEYQSKAVAWLVAWVLNRLVAYEAE